MSKEFYAKYKNTGSNVLNLTFTTLCLKGELEEIDYLLTSSELQINADIHTRNDQGLIFASDSKHNEVMKYLLSSSSLKEHSDIYAQGGLMILHCFSNGNLDMVKFLLSSPNLKENLDIHYDDELPFRTAFNNQHLDILQYLIFDKKIKKTPIIEKFLTEQISNSDFLAKVNNLFSLRNLGENLETELSYTENNTRRLKL